MEDDQLADAARDLAALSMRLLRQLGGHHQEEAPKLHNMTFSPMSFHAILCLLAAGAMGAVRDQIISFLGPAGAEAHAALASKVASYILETHDVDEDEDDDEEPWVPAKVRCATGVWVDSSLILKPAFAAMAASKYKVEVRAISFRGMPAQARAEINEWFESETGGHLKGLLPESSISASTLLVLANALYFRGYWYDHFLPEMTQDDTFYVSPGNEVVVPFMEGNVLHNMMQIGCHPGFKVLRMAYAGCDERFSMYIYLPDNRDGLLGLAHELSSNPTAFLHGKVVPEERVPVGKFKIPKFDVSFKVEASRLLGDLGLDLTLFRPAADSFPEMVMLAQDDAEDILPPVAVPSVIHQCFVHVNEKGTIAAAATGLEILGFCMGTPEQVVDFVADHPFLFFIKEDPSGVVIFAGQVVDPS